MAASEHGQHENGIVCPLNVEMEMPQQRSKKERRFYRADDPMSPHLTILFGFQQVMVCVSALLVQPFILSGYLCPGLDTNLVRVRLISSTFVASGINTIIQTTFGMRLALLQGTAFAYLPSILAFTKLPEYECTNATVVAPEVYEEKLAIIQGCLMATSFVPMLLAFTGLVGKLTKYISPMTVTVLMLLLMFSQIDGIVSRIEKHWVAIIQAIAIFATSMYLADVRVPLPGWKKGKFHWFRVHIFGQYPYLIAILVAWFCCYLLTVLNVIEEGSEARTDNPASLDAIANAPWIRIPYPGQYGWPKFHVGLFFGFLVSAMASVIESIGDYHAIARISHERPPPSHAINRGIFAEGFGSFVSGWLGPGLGLTTHTENIGVIGITKVAARGSLILAGCWLIVLGCLTKVGAVLSTIPDPLIGGVLASSMAMVTGVAISNIQSVDLSNSRNMGVLGFGILVGLVVPTYFKRHPVATGFIVFDQALNVLLRLEMFVGAVTACIMDNTLGGATREQRGLRERGAPVDLGPLNRDIYLLPAWLMAIVKRFPVLEYLPMTPKKKKKGNKVGDVKSVDNDD